MLDRFFRLKEHNTNVRTELLAGLTTFLTMAYIIFLQPAVLFSAGFLVSSFLLPSDDPDPYDLDALIAYWPERVDKRDLLLLMQLFPITLGILKEGELAEDPEGHAENLESIELLMKCLEYIEAASAVPHTP